MTHDATRRLDALTGLRFVAAALVVLSHSQGFFGIPSNWVRHINYANIGGMGVAFFFILSGFILTHVYPSLTNGEARGRFLLARFARIWPAHVFGTLLMIVVFGMHLQAPPDGFTRWGTLFRSLALLHSWIPMRSALDVYDSPTWSVSTEFWFYIFFIFLIHNWARTWWWKLPLTMTVPLAVVIAVPSLGIPPGAPFDKPNYGTFLYYSPIARVYQFAIGMAAALAWRKHGGKLPSAVLPATILETGVAALLIAVSYWSQDVAVGVRDVAGPYGPVLCDLLHGGSLFETLPFAFAIIVFANGKGLISQLFSTRSMVLLGEISYAIYILHFPILEYYRININALGLWGGWQTYVAYWALLLLLSHWLWVGIEAPARRAIVSLWPPGRPAFAGTWLRAGRAFPGVTFAFWRRGVAEFRHWLSQRRGFAAETLAIMAAVGAIGVQATRASSFHFVSQMNVDAFAMNSNVKLQNIRFGDSYLLRGAVLTPIDSGLQLRLIWESLEPQKGWFHAVAHFTDGSGKILQTVERANQFPKSGAAKGQVWEQRIYLPGEFCRASDQIVLSLLGPDRVESYPARDGPLDNHGRLIILEPRRGGSQ